MRTVTAVAWRACRWPTKLVGMSEYQGSRATCPRCGYGNARSANICPKCGHDVPHTSNDLLAKGIAVVIFAGGLIWYFFLR